MKPTRLDPSTCQTIELGDLLLTALAQATQRSHHEMLAASGSDLAAVFVPDFSRPVWAQLQQIYCNALAEFLEPTPTPHLFSVSGPFVPTTRLHVRIAHAADPNGTSFEFSTPPVLSLSMRKLAGICFHTHPDFDSIAGRLAECVCHEVEHARHHPPHTPTPKTPSADFWLERYFGTYSELQANTAELAAWAFYWSGMRQRHFSSRFVMSMTPAYGSWWHTAFVLLPHAPRCVRRSGPQLSAMAMRMVNRRLTQLHLAKDRGLLHRSQQARAQSTK